jgi:uncharacterized protein YuzE
LEAVLKLTHDPQSGALYIRLREGRVSETLELVPDEPGFGAYLDIDETGNVLGAEFLSLEEMGEFIARAGGELALPDRVEDPANFHMLPA